MHVVGGGGVRPADVSAAVSLVVVGMEDDEGVLNSAYFCKHVVVSGFDNLVD